MKKKGFIASILAGLLIAGLLISNSSIGTTYSSFLGGKDVKWWDGVTRTFTRLTSTGGSLSLNKIGSYVDVLEVYGSGTSYTSATLNSAISAVGTNNVIFELQPGTWAITANVTVPSNVVLKMPRGAVLSISTGITVTINGTVDAGLYQIFSLAGTGIVTLVSDNVVYPQWWGALGDGSADDTAELNAAITNAISNNGTVDIPCGNYLISADLAIDNATGVNIVGHGYCSKIYTTTTGVIIFDVSGSNYVKIKNLYLQGVSTGGAVGNIIRLDNVDDSEITGNVLEDSNASSDIILLNPDGTNTKGCDRNLIAGNTLIDSGDAGVRLNGSNNRNRIIGNAITDAATFGVVGDVSDTNEQSHNIVSGNTIKTIGTTTLHHGIRFGNQARFNTISGNTIEDISGDGILIQSSTGVTDHNVIIGNTIKNVEAYGININNSDGSSITGNVILDFDGGSNSVPGINLGTANGCTVTSNTIKDGNSTGQGIATTGNYNTISENTIDLAGAVNYGIYLQGASYNTVIGNTIKDLGDNATAKVGIRIEDIATAGGIYNVIEGNLIRSSDTATYFTQGISIASTVTALNVIEGNLLENLDNNAGAAVNEFLINDASAKSYIVGNFLDDIKVETATVTLPLYDQIELDSSGGAITATLPNGVRVGQTVLITMTDATTSSTVSITSHALGNPTVYTFDAVQDSLKAVWDGTVWETTHTKGIGEILQTLTGAGAVDILHSITHLVTASGGVAADAITLADGIEGQEKIIIYKTETDAGDTSVLTPSNFYNGSTITFSVPGQGAILRFTNGSWRIVVNDGAVA